MARRSNVRVLTWAVGPRYRGSVTISPAEGPKIGAEGEAQSALGRRAEEGRGLGDGKGALHVEAEKDVAAAAGRGGLAVAFAKVYFILQGLLQQIALPRVLGLDGYGAWSTVNSIASVTYNPVIQASIQGVSRAVANAPAAEQAAALRRTLSIHSVIALVLGAGFYVLAPLITESAGAPHVTLGLRILSGAMFFYALYAPLIGALNGQRRFLAQASFDVLAATLRTLGLVGGAWLLSRQAVGFVDGASGSRLGVEGAAAGFVVVLGLITVLALFTVGLGRPGRALSVREHLAFVVPVLFGQVLLNLLLQADLTLLRRFAADAALAVGEPTRAADTLVGAYRATQLFSFLPYQLLISVNFVLFPMLASAVRDGERAAVARYVATGMRIALVVAGLLVSVTAGLSSQLLRLVFGAETAALGGRSLTILALGFGAFAIFGVMTTVLNSLKAQRSSVQVTALGVGAVMLTCFAWVRGTALGEGLLFRTALATAVGLVVATVGAGWMVHRTAGAVVSPKTALRVLAAVAVSVTLGRLAPALGAVATLAACAALALLYLALLLVLRELTRADLALLTRVLGRRPAAR